MPVENQRQSVGVHQYIIPLLSTVSVDVYKQHFSSFFYNGNKQNTRVYKTLGTFCSFKDGVYLSIYFRTVYSDTNYLEDNFQNMHSYSVYT